MLVDYVTTPEVQEQLRTKGCGISVQTAWQWLAKLNWQYTRTSKGMYVDGHEHKDVVEYQKALVGRWKEYEKRFVTFDNDGNELAKPPGFHVAEIGQCCLYLIKVFTFPSIIHMESTWNPWNPCGIHGMNVG